MPHSSPTAHRVGYARVSTASQNLQRQLDAVRDAGCAHVFSDTVSGAKTDRPGLTALKNHVRDGDTVVVTSLDRLGRSMAAVIKLVHDLADEGVTVETLDGLSTNPHTPGGKIVLAVTAAMAEAERDLNRERTNSGLKAARARGRVGGRKPRLTPAQERAIVAVAATGQESLTSIAADFNVSRSTLYRILARHHDERGPGPTATQPGPR